MVEKKTAVMQPYFLPYIGYFQLIASVDHFIIYDNIKYTKKGWINRNHILVNGEKSPISLPLEQGSDFLEIRERNVAVSFNPIKFLNQIKGAYQPAPYFESTYHLLKTIVNYPERNLFEFIHHSIVTICAELQISTKITRSSALPIDHSLKGQDKVLAICKAVDTRIYINAIGGTELYNQEAFRLQNMHLKFIQSKLFEYKQFNSPFVPWLSILDLLMFHSRDSLHEKITTHYDVI